MEKISITSINRDEAFRYMAAEGYVPEGKILEYADECEKRLLSVISPKIAFCVFSVADNDGQRIKLENTALTLTGKDICSHLESCQAAVLICATIGAGADTLIRTLQIEDMAKAIIADSFASAAVEQVCTKIDEMIGKRYADKFITWRFSPGYGDFSIDIQRDMLNVLNASRLAGISVNSSGMLVPVKSVTAVCGISDTALPRKKLGCAGCNMQQNCPYRKKGTHCGF